MTSTCQAGVRSSILRFGGAAAATLALASCGGGDTPETLSQALSDAAGSVEWVADDEQTCVGTAILDTIGFEVLAADEITSETLIADPTIVEDLLDNGSDALDEEVESCIDADRLFRSSLVTDLDIDVADCATDFSESSTAIANRREVLTGGDALELPDSADHRDLLRPCLDETTFGEVFGLDTADDLTAAIHAALPVGLREISTSENCLAARIVDKFGVETLEGLGLEVATPDLDLDVFTDEEQTSIRDAARSCSDAITSWRRSLVNTNEPLADCVVTAEGDAYTAHTIGMAFGDSGARRAREMLVQDGLDACADDRVEELFAPLSSIDRIEADFLARTLQTDWEQDPTFDYLLSEELLRCTLRGTYATLGTDSINTIFYEWSQFDVDSVEAWEAVNPFWITFRESERLCSGDWYFISTEIHQAGTSPETLECIRERLGDDEAIAEMAETYVAYVADWEDYRWESVLSEIDITFDRCRSDAELRIYNEWNEYMFGGLDLTGINSGTDSA